MSIYNNSNGNPLKNSIGNVLCTNYATGNSFLGASTVYCDMPQARSLNLSFPYTFEVFLPKIVNTTSSYCGLLSLVIGGANVSIAIQNHATPYLKLYTALTGIYVGISTYIGVIHVVYINWSTVSIYFNGNFIVTTTQLIATEGAVSSSVFNATFGIVSARYNNPISEFRLYNRQLTAQEIKEIAKLGAYNDAIYPQNLELRYKFDVCEAVDISAAYDGSIIVAGIKDLSGFNRHLQMNGLPAGTLQSKIDYANANYII